MIWIDVALGILAVSFALSLARAVTGGNIADRAVAADVGLYVIVGAIALIAVRTGSTTFIDVVLIATLLGFLATVALAALVGRGDS